MFCYALQPYYATQCGRSIYANHQQTLSEDCWHHSLCHVA
jgi:hypothetical protein